MHARGGGVASIGHSGREHHRHVTFWNRQADRFRYRLEVFQTLVSLIRSGLLNLELVHVSSFALDELPQAIECVAAMRGLDCTVVKMM